MAQPSAPTFLDVAISGLYLNPSTFGNNAPAGALTKADNVVIDRPSVVATRRGFTNAFSTFTNRSIESLFQYNNIMLAYTSDNKLSVDLASNGTFTNYPGTYLVPDASNPASRIRAIEVNKNFYYITDQGTWRLDSPAGTPRLAGAPPGLYGSTAITGSTGWMPATTNVAYRVVFGFRDANQQLVLGAPSGRIMAANTGSTTANVNVTFQIPKEVQASPTNWIFQVYRGNASPNLATEPDDVMALCYEDLCTGAATQTILDNTPSSLLGAALYTNASQNGILQSNYRPPHATDICTFKQYAFYANTRTLQTSNLTLVAAGASNGSAALTPPQTITFTPAAGDPTSPFTLTADTTNNFSTGHFAVSNTGNPGYDIQATAANICLVANAYSGNTFLEAYYISSDTDLPGQMAFTRATLSPYAFTITTSNPSALCWQQPFPVVSVNDVKPNRVYFSEFNQPEAVPIVNYFDVGSANQPINRILPLRNGIIVLKQDGIFYVSDNTPPFTITPINYDIKIFADNTAVVADNKIYFLSNQGVIAINDTASENMSYAQLDITMIQAISPTLYPNLQQTAWAVAYQSDHKYILNLPTTGTDTQSTQQYVYNYLSQQWVRWTRKASCGLVFNKDGYLYLGSASNGTVGSAPGTNNNYLYQERKSRTNEDYADDQYSTMVTQINLPLHPTTGASNNIVIQIPSLPAGVSVIPGWTIREPHFSSQAIITAVTPIDSTHVQLTLDSIQFWDLVNPVTLYTPIYSEVQTIQLDCQNPGMNKQFSEIVYLFTVQSFNTVTTTISSDMANQPVSDIITPQVRGGWGYDVWGPTPWGGTPLGQGKVRRYVPQAIQRSGWLYVNITHAESFTSFGWSGAQIFYKNTSSRQK